MKVIQFELPDEILITLKETPEELTREIRMLAAVQLYQKGKLSSGRAAELAGVSKVSFLQALSRSNVPIFNLSGEELKSDFKNA